MVILNNKNVGIGTTNPIYKLHAQGPTNDWTSIFYSGNNSVHLAHGGGYGLFVGVDTSYSDANHYIAHFANNSKSNAGASALSVMFIRADGNVGIGTNSPAYTLDVNGSLNAISINSGNITTSGISASGTSNRIIFRHLDGQNCNGDYNLYLQYHHPSSTIYCRGAYINLDSGNWSSYITTSTFAAASHGHDSLIMSNTAPLIFYGSGSGVYNLACLYCRSSGATVGLVFETPRASDSSSGTVLPFNVCTRGGQYAHINASAYYVASDIRYKKIEDYLTTSVEDIAQLPIFNFTWIDGTYGLHSGTSALAVKKILPNLVTGDKKLTLNYANLGMIEGVIAAREIVKLKEENILLHNEINKLKQEVENLKNNY